MSSRLTHATWLAAALMLLPAGAPAQTDADDVPIRALLQRIESSLQRNDPAGYTALLHASADPKSAAEFVEAEFRPNTTRAVVQERDRQRLKGTLPGNGYSLTVDAFSEFGDRARIATWQLDIRKSADDQWTIAGEERLSTIENLYRLSVNTTRQFEAKSFTLLAEDLELTLVEGTVFTVDTDQGTTGLILLGHGELKFHPPSETEKGQVRIFSGSDTLETRFDAAYVRVGTLEMHADRSVLVPRPVDARDLRRAEQVFRDESAKSFLVDLADLSRDNWSLLPAWDDFLAEIRTRRFDTLTYARSSNEAEDVSLFDRRHKRNISVYPSREKLASRGRFYSEDEFSAYDVLDYDIEVAATPERQWIEGVAKMRIRVRASSLGQITIRLADSLIVRSIVSSQFGRLFSLRVPNQNAVLVNLPATLLQDTEMTLSIAYGGRLEPQPADRETLLFGAVGQDRGSAFADDPMFPRPEASYLYSNQSYWYPQSPITDYATATIQISVPAAYSCVASGEVSSDSPELLPAKDPKDPTQARKLYLFTAERPLRYLAFVVTKLARADRWTVAFDRSRGSKRVAVPGRSTIAPYEKLDLIVDANPRQTARGREVAERAVDIVQYYESLIGDSPYSAFTVALVENMLPGGHSPGYFAVLNQPLPNSGLTWRNDPASFSNYPEFFLAHEIAHQWWGQAVGWRNYHEQWLSEGFAQYFAALYAQRYRGDASFANVLRQMRKWAIEESPEGPVYLGYRVGHIRNDGRAFRAVVYNKGAAVLHMLRRLIGDDAFFAGMRRFYAESRFRKVGSDDLRQAMEAESGQSLERFFERWVYNSALPKIAFSYRVEASSKGSEAVLHFEQSGELFDLPVTVTVQYADRRATDVVVPVRDRVVDFRVPLSGPIRTIDVSKDDGTLAEIGRGS
jgi:Peptidase family M1 domain